MRKLQLGFLPWRRGLGRVSITVPWFFEGWAHAGASESRWRGLRWPGRSSARPVHNPQPLETFQVCAAVTEGFRWLPRGTAEIIPQGLLFKPTGAFTFAWWKSIQMQRGFSLSPDEQASSPRSLGQAVARAEGIRGPARLRYSPARKRRAIK